MKTRQILPLLILLLLALGGCRQADDAGASAAEGEEFVRYEDAGEGIAVGHPASWVVHEEYSGVTLASSDDVVQAESLASIEEGAFVTILPKELAVFGAQTGETFSSDEPIPALQMYRGLINNAGDQLTVVEEPQAQPINGQQMATMTVTLPIEGEQVKTILAVVINDEFAAFVSAGALEDAFAGQRATLQRIIESIEVSKPAGLGS